VQKAEEKNEAEGFDEGYVEFIEEFYTEYIAGTMSAIELRILGIKDNNDEKYSTLLKRYGISAND
jgi:hypothetical protein